MADKFSEVLQRLTRLESYIPFTPDDHEARIKNLEARLTAAENKLAQGATVFTNTDYSGLGNGVVYTNTTGKPMFVSLSLQNGWDTRAWGYLNVQGRQVGYFYQHSKSDTLATQQLSAIVPPGATYQFSWNGQGDYAPSGMAVLIFHRCW